MKRRSVDASLQLKSNAGAGGAALAAVALTAIALAVGVASLLRVVAVDLKVITLHQSTFIISNFVGKLPINVVLTVKKSAFEPLSPT